MKKENRWGWVKGEENGGGIVRSTITHYTGIYFFDLQRADSVLRLCHVPTLSCRFIMCRVYATSPILGESSSSVHLDFGCRQGAGKFIHIGF